MFVILVVGKWVRGVCGFCFLLGPDPISMCLSLDPDPSLLFIFLGCGTHVLFCFFVVLGPDPISFFYFFLDRVSDVSCFFVGRTVPRFRFLAVGSYLSISWLRPDPTSDYFRVRILSLLFAGSYLVWPFVGSRIIPSFIFGERIVSPFFLFLAPGRVLLFVL